MIFSDCYFEVIFIHFIYFHCRTGWHTILTQQLDSYPEIRRRSEQKCFCDTKTAECHPDLKPDTTLDLGRFCTEAPEAQIQFSQTWSWLDPASYLGQHSMTPLPGRCRAGRDQTTAWWTAGPPELPVWSPGRERRPGWPAALPSPSQETWGRTRTLCPRRTSSVWVIFTSWSRWIQTAAMDSHSSQSVTDNNRH